MSFITLLTCRREIWSQPLALLPNISWSTEYEAYWIIFWNSPTHSLGSYSVYCLIFDDSLQVQDQLQSNFTRLNSDKNQIVFSLNLRNLCGSNFRYLEQILTVPLSSNQWGSTVIYTIRSWINSYQDFSLTSSQEH
jgi:hypothetical protein